MSQATEPMNETGYSAEEEVQQLQKCGFCFEVAIHGLKQNDPKGQDNSLHVLLSSGVVVRFWNSEQKF